MTGQLQRNGTGSTSSASSLEARRFSWASIFVWAVWLLMVGGALALVGRYGSNAPSWDDWDMVPFATGHEPVTLDWLWSQHNEHRVPLPRLIMLGLAKVFGMDFRVWMYANVVVLASLAAGAIVVMRGARGGRTIAADAFFPIALLHWGHAVNLLWGWQVQFFSSAALSMLILLMIVRSIDERRRKRATFIAAGCTVLLTLCGANGLGLVPALVVWLFVVGAIWWRSGDRRGAIAIGLIATTAATLTVLYFVGYEPVPYHPQGGIRTMLRTAPKFLALGWGPAARPLALALVPITCLLFAVTGWWIVRSFRARADRSTPLPTIGLFYFCGAIVCLALGLGRGRDGFEPRYVVLAVPGLLAIFFTAGLIAPPRIGRLVQTVMVLVAAGTLWPNVTAGRQYAFDVRQALGGFLRAVAADTPRHKLIPPVSEWLHPHDDVIAEYLPMLRATGATPYAEWDPKESLQEVPVPLESAEVAGGVTWDTDSSTVTALRGVRGPSYLKFRLDPARHIAGIRLRFVRQGNSTTVPYTKVLWTTETGSDAFAKAYSRKISPTGDRRTWGSLVLSRAGESEVSMTTWVDAPAAAIFISADLKSGPLKVVGLSILVEPDAVGR